MTRRARVVFSAVLVALLAVACSPKPELRRFAPADAPFVVSMPGEPEHEQQSQDTPLGRVTAHVYVSTFDDVVYAVNYQRFPDGTARQWTYDEQQAAYDDGRTILLSASGATRVASEGHVAAKVGGRIAATGRQFVLDLPNGATMTVRQFLHGDVLHQVATTVPANAYYNQNLFADRFLESFEIR